MGFLSQSGHIGLKTQATKGVFLDPGAADPNDGVFMYIRSGAMGGDRELLIPDPEIGGNRDIPDAQLGPISYSGEFDFYGRMESMATLVQGVQATLRGRRHGQNQRRQRSEEGAVVIGADVVGEGEQRQVPERPDGADNGAGRERTEATKRLRLLLGLADDVEFRETPFKHR